MKFSFHAAPNYRGERSTTGIMKDVTLCLLAVLVFSAVWYSVSYGVEYGIRVVCLALAGVISALATEAVYFKACGKKDILTEVKHSYGWITPLIIVLISTIDVSYYAVIISTILAIVFGKLVFGGFGQNIFNPAALGAAIIMNSFSGTASADFTTSATPMTSIQEFGWIADGSAVSSVMSEVGGVWGLLTGNYPTSIGGGCAILILLCFAYLIYKDDIDWETSAVYFLSVFVISAIACIFNGNGPWFILMNILGNSVLFCGVFMLTDPVTSPVSRPGRVIYAVGAACLTLMIRWKANLPDGALYSILLMNMLTPAIELACDGSQIKDIGKITRNVAITSAVVLLVGIFAGATLSGTAEEETVSTAEATAEVTAETSSGAVLSETDYSEYEAECTAEGDGVYACSAKGFGLVNNAGDDYSENEATITIADGAVVSVEITNFGDTEGVGDAATEEDALSAYEGVTITSDVDSVSGATFTSESIAAMVQAALQAAAE